MLNLRLQRKNSLHMKTKQYLIPNTQRGFRNVQSYLNLLSLTGMDGPQFRAFGSICGGLVSLQSLKLLAFKSEEYVLSQDKNHCMWEDGSKKTFTTH